jgi:hypothetical protein
MRFTIYRDSWLRGEEGSTLHRLMDDKECCMGQMCAQLGVAPFRITGYMYPSQLTEAAKYNVELRDFIEKVSPVETRIGLINDAEESTGGNRESQIKSQMESLGYEIEFVDGKAPWIEG